MKVSNLAECLNNFDEVYYTTYLPEKNVQPPPLCLCRQPVRVQAQLWRGTAADAVIVRSWREPDDPALLRTG